MHAVNDDWSDSFDARFKGTFSHFDVRVIFDLEKMNTFSWEPAPPSESFFLPSEKWPVLKGKKLASPKRKEGKFLPFSVYFFQKGLINIQHIKQEVENYQVLQLPFMFSRTNVQK